MIDLLKTKRRMFYQLCRMTNGFDAPFEVNAVVKVFDSYACSDVELLFVPFNYSMPMSCKNGK